MTPLTVTFVVAKIVCSYVFVCVSVCVVIKQKKGKKNTSETTVTKLKELIESAKQKALI